MADVPNDCWIPREGERFYSFEEGDSVLINWARSLGEEIAIADCKTIETANYNMTINPKLIYVYVVYKCVFHGTYVPKGTGQKKSKSRKCHCPVFIKLKQKYGTYLEIVKVELQHNAHPKFIEIKGKETGLTQEQKEIECQLILENLKKVFNQMPLDHFQKEMVNMHKLIKVYEEGRSAKIVRGKVFSVQAQNCGNFGAGSNNNFAENGEGQIETPDPGEVIFNGDNSFDEEDFPSIPEETLFGTTEMTETGPLDEQQLMINLRQEQDEASCEAVIGDDPSKSSDQLCLTETFVLKPTRKSCKITLNREIKVSSMSVI